MDKIVSVICFKFSSDESDLIKSNGILDCFNKFKINQHFKSYICQTITAEMLMNGEEWSPQKWLGQPHLSTDELAQSIKEINLSLYRAVAAIPIATLPKIGWLLSMSTTLFTSLSTLSRNTAPIRIPANVGNVAFQFDLLCP